MVLRAVHGDRFTGTIQRVNRARSGVSSGPMRSRRTKTVLAHLGANVRRRRIRLDLTQERLAEAAGVEARYLQDVERGRVNLSMDVLVALAEALGVDPRALLKPSTLPPPRPGRPPKRRSPRSTK
jgi:DNA-binding XRE family transcriptional regulator